jgi:hypothetical protein
MEWNDGATLSELDRFEKSDSHSLGWLRMLPLAKLSRYYHGMSLPSPISYINLADSSRPGFSGWAFGWEHHIKHAKNAFTLESSIGSDHVSSLRVGFKPYGDG